MRPNENQKNVAWQSLSFEVSDGGFTVSERFDRFRQEALTESVLRVCGISMIAGSILLWLMLPTTSLAGSVASRAMLVALFAATGLFVFAYGTRGFRRQLVLDLDRAVLSLTKININGQSRVARQVPLQGIQSLFLRRPRYGSGQASLYVRIVGIPVPVRVICGDLRDIEALHRELCFSIKPDQAYAPQQVFTAGGFPALAA